MILHFQNQCMEVVHPRCAKPYNVNRRIVRSSSALQALADDSSRLRLSRDREYRSTSPYRRSVPSTNGTAIAIATAIIAAAKPSLRSYLRGCSVVVARTRCSCGLVIGYFTVQNVAGQKLQGSEVTPSRRALPPASPQCRFRSFRRTSPPFANVRRGSLIFLKTPLLKANDERKEKNELMNSTATADILIFHSASTPRHCLSP